LEADREPLSKIQRQGDTPLPFALKAFALIARARTRCHARIASAFEAMLAAGWSTK